MSDSRCPKCKNHLNVDADYAHCWRCEAEVAKRRCIRCHGKLSRWNRGEVCNPCWESMSIEQRGSRKYAGEGYNPNIDLERERRLDRLALDKDDEDE